MVFILFLLLNNLIFQYQYQYFYVILCLYSQYKMHQQVQNLPQQELDTQNKIIAANHSLSADIAMGWKPNLKIIGPVPLNFDNPYIDKSIKQILKSEASFYYVCYLGPRPSNTFKMHQIINKNYRYKYTHLYSVDYGHLKTFFNKFYGEFEPLMKRPFYGMNPNKKAHPIIFDSNFESGNLDCAVKVDQNQYDLIVRIDSNTAGHIMWYYFRVSNTQDKQKTIRLNIVNLRKNKSCYQRGMKPYMRKSPDGLKWSQWQQNGNNIQMCEQKIRFGKQTIIFQNNMIGLQDQIKLFRCLSFDITVLPFQSYEIAYCIPYTYSDLLMDIKYLKKKCQLNKRIHFQVDNSNQSLSGLQIPVIKITDNGNARQEQLSKSFINREYKEKDQKKKYAVFIIGRQHPGESNSSHVTKGILQQLVMDSPQIDYLRKKCVFKIIPMLNVDGVTIGNFRTSFYGKDLNRLFKKSQLFLIPEVELCKDQFQNLQKIHKKKILLFLDIHGHSVRRNSFCYGPGILDANAFSDVRELAKIISTKTQIFRYPSCTFRINNDKKTTARACFSKSVGLAYTIQSSNWSYYSKQNSKMTNFTSKSWNSVGQALIQGILEYLYQKIKLKRSKKKKGKDQNSDQQQFIYIPKDKSKNIQKSSKLLSSSKKIQDLLKIQRNQGIKQTSQKQQQQTTKTGREQKRQSNNTLGDQYSEQQNFNININIRYSDNPKISHFRALQISKIEQAELDQENQSDKFSENQMDSDSQGEDLSKEQFDKYITGAKKMMIQFQKAYYGDQYEKKGTILNKMKSIHNVQKPSNRIIKKNYQVLACLRKKQVPEKIDIASKMQINSRKNNNNNNEINKPTPTTMSTELKEPFSLSLRNQIQKGLTFDYKQMKIPNYQISNRMKSKSNSQPIKEKNQHQNQNQNQNQNNFRNFKNSKNLDLQYEDDKGREWADQQYQQYGHQNERRRNLQQQQQQQQQTENYFQRYNNNNNNNNNNSKNLQKYSKALEEYQYPSKIQLPNKLQTIEETINEGPHFAVQNKSLKMMKSNHKHKRQIDKYLKDQNLDEKKEIYMQQINFPLSVQISNPRKSGKMIANCINHIKQLQNENISCSISPKKHLEFGISRRISQQKKSFTAHSNKYLPNMTKVTSKIASNINLEINTKKNPNSSKQLQNQKNLNLKTPKNVFLSQGMLKLKTNESESDQKYTRKSAKSTAKKKIQSMLNQQKKINLNSNINFEGLASKVSSNSSYLPKIKANIKRSKITQGNQIQNSNNLNNLNNNMNLMISIVPSSMTSLPSNLRQKNAQMQSERKRYKQIMQSQKDQKDLKYKDVSQDIDDNNKPTYQNHSNNISNLNNDGIDCQNSEYGKFQFQKWQKSSVQKNKKIQNQNLNHNHNHNRKKIHLEQNNQHQPQKNQYQQYEDKEIQVQMQMQMRMMQYQSETYMSTNNNNKNKNSARKEIEKLKSHQL